MSEGSVDRTAGFTLVEALVALAIAGFVMVALGNLISFMVGQQHRLAASEADIEEAVRLSDTIGRLVTDMDPASLRLDADGLRFASTGLPQSAMPEQLQPINLAIQGDGEVKDLVLAIGAPAAQSSEDDIAGRPQPLLTKVSKLAIEVHVQRGNWVSEWDGKRLIADRLRLIWQHPGFAQRKFAASIGSGPATTLCIRIPSASTCRSQPL